jgi:hypothetical protein
MLRDDPPERPSDDVRQIRRLLQMTPEQRLRALSAAYPLVRVGLLRRAAAGGARKP